MGGVDQQKVKQVVYEMSKVRLAGLIVPYLQAPFYSSSLSLSAGISRSLQPHHTHTLLAQLQSTHMLSCLQNSAHYAQEQRKQAQADARVARLKAQAAAISPAQLAAYQK